MTGYHGIPQLAFEDEVREAIVLSDFGFVCDEGEIWSYEGDLVNGASIPRFCWRVVGAPYYGRHRWACIIHDACYFRKDMERKEVDRIWLQALKYSDVNFAKRHMMYRAVRLFGPRF